MTPESNNQPTKADPQNPTPPKGDAAGAKQESRKRPVLSELVDEVLIFSDVVNGQGNASDGGSTVKK